MTVPIAEKRLLIKIQEQGTSVACLWRLIVLGRNSAGRAVCDREGSS